MWPFLFGYVLGSAPFLVWFLISFLRRWRRNEHPNHCACGKEIFFTRTFIVYGTMAHTQAHCGPMNMIVGFDDTFGLFFSDGTMTSIR